MFDKSEKKGFLEVWKLDWVNQPLTFDTFLL